MTRAALRNIAALGAAALAVAGCASASAPAPGTQTTPAPSGLWQVHDQSLKGAKHIDLTHAIALS